MWHNSLNNMKISVIIVAAGKGTRMNISGSKQFINLKNTPVLVHTISKFVNIPLLNEIIVVVNSDDILFCSEVLKNHKLNNICKIVEGGKERQNSVYNGLRETDTKSDIILIHDGARPFVTEQVVINTIKASIEHSSAVCAVKVKDTIKTVSSNGFVTDTPERSLLWSIQTPQGFSRNIILKAHEYALENNLSGTDDAVLVEKLGIPTKIVEGSYLNIKITTQEDLIFGEAILNMESQ